MKPDRQVKDPRWNVSILAQLLYQKQRLVAGVDCEPGEGRPWPLLLRKKTCVVHLWRFHFFLCKMIFSSNAVSTRSLAVNVGTILRLTISNLLLH